MIEIDKLQMNINHLIIWDSAAGVLIVWEAGGEVLNCKGDLYSTMSVRILPRLKQTPN